jgi:hypothetical protein
MSSLIDYIFKRLLGKCVVILISILGSSRISIKFMMRVASLSVVIGVVVGDILAITFHFFVPVLFLTGILTNGM